MTRPRTGRAARRTLLACIGALVIASVAHRLLIAGRLEHTSLVFIGIPAILAVALTALQPRTSTGTVNKTIAIALCLSGILFGEGFICILMASPLFFAVGTFVGRLRARRDEDESPRGTAWRHYGVALLAPLALEGVVPKYEIPRAESVVVTRIVPADADAVRDALAAPMRFDATLPLFFRLGFPTPGFTSGAGLELGDRRTVEFRHDGHHPGTLTLAVRRSEPGHVVFTAISDDSYITHWLSWQSADVRWRELGPGRTEVTWTLRYTRRLDPAFYFKPLERYGATLAAAYLIETLATPIDRGTAERVTTRTAPVSWPRRLRHEH